MVDRVRERAELQAALGDAQAGKGRFLLLAGQPGIGKTRLAEAAAERAEAEGVSVVWGHCWESGGAPAFWPWPQVVRGIARQRDPDQLRSELGRGAAWVAHLMPELADLFPELGSPPALESEQARFSLFDAISGFVSAASRSGPLLIVLDDLHAADPGSLLLLGFLARDIRKAQVFVLGTTQEVREGDRAEVQALMAELGREGRRIIVGGLDEESTAELMANRGGITPSPGLVRALHSATEGNPFFSGEVVRLLAADGRLEGDTDDLREHFPLPDTVRETIRRRFQTHDPALIELLGQAAVIGRQFQLATLARARGVDPEQLMPMLDQAIRAGLLIPVSVGTLRFAHGLMREVLYDDLSPAIRAERHRAVGEALETLHSSDAKPPLPQLAHHFLEAAPGGDVEKAIDYATRGGREAMELLAYEQAARLFRLALTTGDSLAPDPTRRTELLLALGQAQVHAGDATGRETLIEAADAARSLGRPDVIAQAALGFRAFALSPGIPDEKLVALLEESLERIGDGDPALRARLLARLAVSLYYSDTVDRREELIGEAVAVARALDDRATLAHVISNGQLATWGPDTTQRSLEWADELIGLADTTHDPEVALVSRHRQIDLLLELDDVVGADIGIQAFERLAEDNPDPRAAAYVPLHRSRRALMEGDQEEAERLNAEAIAVSARLGDPTLHMLTSAQLFGIRWVQGRLGELETQTRRFADGAPGMPVWRAALALIYCDLGRDAEAARELDRLAQGDFSGIPRDNVWPLAMALLSEVCLHLGDAARATKIAGLLAPFSGQNIVSPHAIFAGPVPLYLGILARASGQVDEAARQLEAAAAAAGKTGDQPALDRVKELRGQLGAGAPALPVSEPPPPAEEPYARASLAREGDVWAFDYGGRTVRVRHSKGLAYLAELLRSPGNEVHSLDLVRLDQPAPAASASPGAAAELDVRGAGEDDAGPVLDPTAKAAYRDRLESLSEEIEEAESFNDPERAARARQEMDFLAQELSGAVGLHGRDRKVGSSAERARVNVTRAIRSALGRVAEHDTELGQELEATIRTGTFCAHVPDPRRPVDWKVQT